MEYLFESKLELDLTDRDWEFISHLSWKLFEALWSLIIIPFYETFPLFENHKNMDFYWSFFNKVEIDQVIAVCCWLCCTIWPYLEKFYPHELYCLRFFIFFRTLLHFSFCIITQSHIEVDFSLKNSVIFKRFL